MSFFDDKLPRFYWFFILLFLPLSCEALELKPWFGNNYETECRVSLLYQNYNTVSASERRCARRSENDAFSTLNVAYPFKRYLGQFEITGANTRHQDGRIDNFRIAGAYQWLSDDQYGDPFSLATTIILTEPLSRALHDISSFHHGHIEGEFCVSYGKKYGCPCSKDYVFRWWNVLGFGGADVGSPWLRGDAVCEYKLSQIHHFRGFINTLWGLGRQRLDACHFKGYGPIRHQSVDIGVRYSYGFGYWGTFSVQYARRVYAYNFPENTNLLFVEYYMPFGRQESINY